MERGLRLVVHLSSPPKALRRHRVLLIKVEVLVVTSLVASGGSRKSIKLSCGVELGLGLHERSTIVGHKLVPRIGVLSEEDNGSRHDKHKKKNEGESRVKDEENDAHNTNDDLGQAKDVGEDEKENCVDKVDGTNGNVERVGGLVHPGSENRSGNQITNFNDNEANSLSDAVLLGQGHKHGLDQGVDQNRNDEVVGRCSELDIEETPLVESLGIREEDVGRVAVHGDGAASDADNLTGTPGETEDHAKEEEDGQDNFGRRVALGKLPKAENSHLGETNQGQAEQNTLEDGEPAVAEVHELVLGHPVLANAELQDALEGGQGQERDDNKGAKEGQTCHEQVCRLNLGLEGNTLNTVDGICAVIVLNVSTLGEVDNGSGHHCRATLEEVDTARGKLQTSLLNFDGNRANGVEDGFGGTASGSLIPSENILHESDLDNSHRPLEVLSPRRDNGGESNAGKTENSLRLEIAEKGERVGSDVSSRVGVTDTRHNGRGDKSQSSNDGSCPLDTHEINRLSIGEVGFHTSDRLSRVAPVDVNTDGGIEIGNSVGDSRNLLEVFLADREVELEGNLARNHGAETRKVVFARIKVLLEELVTVGGQSNVKDDLALDGRSSSGHNSCGAVVWRQGDLEHTGTETVLLLTGVERVGIEQLLTRYGRRQGGY